MANLAVVIQHSCSIFTSFRVQISSCRRSLYFSSVPPARFR